MKHICLFSGGAASSYMSWMVAQEYDKKDVILLHTPTYSEHPDADRFRKEVSDYIGIPITTQEDGRDIWELIDDEHCLPSHFIPFCTRILKLEQSEKFYKTLSEDFVIYVGFGIREWKRVQKQVARFECMGRKSSYPLFEQKINDCFIKYQIENEWGIKLPETYKHLKHNNCIPCFKAGLDEWKMYWMYYPEQFWKASDKEKRLGHTVFIKYTLEELADKWQHNQEFDKSQISIDSLPCMCSI